MKRNISSDHTSGIKSSLSALSLMGVGFAIASVIFFDNITDVISYAPVILAISYAYFRLVRLAKRIGADDTFLYVSDNETEIKIPIFLARPAACPRKQRFRTGLQTPSGSGEMIQAAVTNKLVFLILLNILLLILGAILDIFSAHPSGSCELRN